MRNIGNQLAVYFTITLLVVAGGLGLIAYKSAANALENNTKDSFIELADQVAQTITMSNNLQISTVETIANRPDIRSMDWEIQLPALIDELERKKYIDIGVAAPDGILHRSGGAEVDINNREYFTLPIQGISKISEPIVSRDGSLIIVTGVPIKDENNKVHGVLMVTLDGRALNSITNAVHFGDNVTAHIINGEGTIIAHPDENFVLEQKNIIAMAQEDKTWEGLAQINARMINGEKGFESYLFQGQDIYVGYSPIEGTDWSVAITAPRSEVMAGLDVLKTQIMFLTFFFILLGLVMAYFIGRHITTPITILSRTLKRLGNYDLSPEEDTRITKYLRNKDEIGIMAHALTNMQNNFVQILKEIDTKSNQVAAASQEMTAISNQAATAAEEMAKTIEEMARGSSDQAKDTEQGALNINEMSTLIDNNYEHMQELHDRTNAVSGLKDEGFNALEILLNKTTESNAAISQISIIIQDTNNSTEGIKTASGVIKSIADQTNLLALNAAIEAARAGEHGQGFAVVAEEVRKLAEQSNHSVLEIEAIVNELTFKTNRAVNTMNDVKAIVDEQTASVTETKGKFEGIAQAIEKTKEVIEKLNDSEKALDLKKNKIIEIVQSLSAIAQENAAGTEEAAASVEEQTASVLEIASTARALTNLAEDMQNHIRKFKY